MPPIQHAFLHFPNIGPARADVLRACGYRTWQDILDASPEQFPMPQRLQELKQWAAENVRAYQRGDIQFFVDNLVPADRWRLLLECWDKCVFLDIETAGLERNDAITVISCWNGQRVSLFVNGENLDDFPDYALTIPIIVTFNGASFDIPVITRYFNLPDLPVPHVDLRWICHRCNLDGGLKAIERQLDIRRPQDLVGTNGFEAVELWSSWTRTHAPQARAKLLRYCAADTIALQHVAARILADQSQDATAFQLDRQRHWQILDDAVPPPPSEPTTCAPAQGEPACGIPASTAAEIPQAIKLQALRAKLKAFLEKKRTN